MTDQKHSLPLYLCEDCDHEERPGHYYTHVYGNYIARPCPKCGSPIYLAELAEKDRSL